MEYILAEDKIPVLTTVYKPKADKKSSPEISGTKVTADLVAQITAQVRVRLEAEMTDFLQDGLKDGATKAHHAVIASTQDFVDKTKADLRTEIPRMYQESVKLAQVDTEALKQSALNEAIAFVRKEMADFQVKIVQDYQTQINETLKSIEQRAEENASEQIGIMHSRVSTMQQEAFAKLTDDFSEQKDSMLYAARAEIKSTFAGQMSEGHALLKANIEAILNSAIPGMESRLREQLVSDLEALLLRIKFTLPD